MMSKDQGLWDTAACSHPQLIRFRWFVTTACISSRPHMVPSGIREIHTRFNVHANQTRPCPYQTRQHNILYKARESKEGFSGESAMRFSLESGVLNSFCSIFPWGWALHFFTQINQSNIDVVHQDSSHREAKGRLGCSPTLKTQGVLDGTSEWDHLECK